ncbi:MAG: lipid II:glycine glycyltransferase FemX [Thermodesulfobacteriota bacterium]
MGVSQTVFLSPLTTCHYDRLLEATPQSTFFHSSAWCSVLSRSYGFKPFYLAKEGPTGYSVLFPVMEVRSRITGTRGVCLPFTDHCEPLLANGQIDRKELLEGLAKKGRQLGWRYLEWRGEPGLSGEAVPASRYIGHLLELSLGEKDIFRRLRESTRRNIRRAQREGLEATIRRSEEAIWLLWELQCLTRKKHGLPPQPRRFFRAIWEEAVCKDLGFVVAVSRGAKPVAASLLLYFGGQAVFKYGASDPHSAALRGSYLAMWEAIKECIERGCTRLSLGRTAPSNSGLLQFKRGWAAKEQEIPYYRYDLRSRRFVSAAQRESGWYNVVVRKLPLPISRLLGELLYPHLA